MARVITTGNNWKDERIAGVVAIVLGVLVILAPTLLLWIVAAALIIYGITRFI